MYNIIFLAMSEKLKKAEKIVKKYMKKIGYRNDIDYEQFDDQNSASVYGYDPLTGSRHGFSYGWDEKQVVNGVSYNFDFAGDLSDNDWINVKVGLKGKKGFKKFVKSLYKPTHIDLMNQSRGSNLLWDESDSYALATVIDKFPGIDQEYDPINGSTQVKIGFGSWIGASEKGFILSTL